MSKETQVAELLEDGTIYTFDLEVCDKEAEKVMKRLHKKEGKLFNYDFNTTVYALFVYNIHVLRAAGWSTQELAEELFNQTEPYDEEEGIGLDDDQEEDDDL